MRLHDLRPAKGATHRVKRVGRGESSGRGKTSGRGMKGSRARGSVPANFEGGQIPLQRRLPKLGGFRPRNRVEFEVVNLGRLDAVFADGDTVDRDALRKAGLVSRRAPIKVLAQGDLSKRLVVRANAFSKQAAEKIKAAGGTAEVIAS